MESLPSSVAIVGVGGLGCPASLDLALKGVKHLTLLDPDVVDVTNLHRQPWHHPADVGLPKVESARLKLQRAFSHLSVTARQEPLTALNADEVFANHDVVLDGTDAVEAKFLISDMAVKAGGVAIYGGVLRFEGLAMRVQPGGPCLRCLFERPPDDVPTCAQAGVMGSMAGVVGGLMGQLASRPEPTVGVATLHVIDGAALTARRVRVRRRADCATCGGAP